MTNPDMTVGEAFDLAGITFEGQRANVLWTPPAVEVSPELVRAVAEALRPAVVEAIERAFAQRDHTEEGDQ